MRLLIVAAHPDDETIGASALLGSARESIVVHATDGAPRDPRWWPPGVPDRGAYASARVCEAERALGVVGARAVRLGFVDQELARVLPELIEAIADQLAAWEPDLIVAHAYEGGHPDHDAIALAVSRARAAARSRAPLLEMALYHGARGTLAVGELIGRGGAPERYLLRDDELRRRRAMLDCFASQRATLAPFLALAHERYRLAPAHDFTRPPHDGPLWYERLGMARGDEWRALAARARRAGPVRSRRRSGRGGDRGRGRGGRAGGRRRSGGGGGSGRGGRRAACRG